MDYMCAFESAELRCVTEGTSAPCRMRVPARALRRVLHEANVASIQRTGSRSSRGCRARRGVCYTPDFEVYDERFDAATGDGGVEIWLGVQSPK